MPDPSVTKAFAESITPVLKAAGFAADGTKRFRRISGDLCQCLFVHVQNRGRREFMLEYCTFLTVVPHTHYPLDHGGGFPVGTTGRWYRADTEDRLAHSMTLLVDQLPPLLGWFDKTHTISGYISTYLELRQKQSPDLAQNGHFSFNLACACALAGDSVKALSYATQALKEFENIVDRIPATQQWAVPSMDRCRHLIEHLGSTSVSSLFDDWRQVTYTFLKIGQ